MPEPEALKPNWFHILLSLADQRLHGSAIVEEVLERTAGTVRLWPGALYGSLRDLAERGLITEVEAPEDAPTEGGKRRFYTITLKGGRALRDEVERMAFFVRVARDKDIGASRPERA